jgi:D-aminopeptidase
MRARELGIEIGRGASGPNNAITDVAGVRVGHTTLIEGEGKLVTGQGPVRTGVTVVVPHDRIGDQPLFAGCHRLNGNGELTGLEWVRESGTLTTPIALTNTHSVGVVRDALIGVEVRRRGGGSVFWSLPVVGETCDATLSDINGMHVRPEHLEAALGAAAAGPVPEGNVGGGTGMICHEFKGGIGTSSRLLAQDSGGFTVGVLVQANYGSRERLTVDGIPVGREIPTSEIPSPYDHAAAESGSIIAVVATDAPLLPMQCARLAQRAGLGIARAGGVAANSSGDLFICFSTGNRGRVPDPQDKEAPVTSSIEVYATGRMTELFTAVVDATEEAILNALLAAETMTGRDGITAYALPHDRLLDVMDRYGRRG